MVKFFFVLQFALIIRVVRLIAVVILPCLMRLKQECFHIQGAFIVRVCILIVFIFLFVCSVAFELFSVFRLVGSVGLVLDFI